MISNYVIARPQAVAIWLPGVPYPPLTRVLPHCGGEAFGRAHGRAAQRRPYSAYGIVERGAALARPREGESWHGIAVTERRDWAGTVADLPPQRRPYSAHGIVECAAALARPREVESWHGIAVTERGVTVECKAGTATLPYGGTDQDLIRLATAWRSTFPKGEGFLRTRGRGGRRIGAPTGTDAIRQGRAAQRRPYGSCPLSSFRTSVMESFRT